MYITDECSGVDINDQQIVDRRYGKAIHEKVVLKIVTAFQMLLPA